MNNSYQLRQVIVKEGDDLRHEQIVMQVLKLLKKKFKIHNIPLYLRPYEIVILSKSSSIIGIKNFIRIYSKYVVFRFH